MNSRHQVATEVKVAMVRAGLTQTALADRISMSRATLSDSLHAKRAFNTDELTEIAVVVGVSPLAFLLGNGGQPPAALQAVAS